ncbi:winged helix-turn-helix domain-containing protein, partial [Clavibacter michiganensis]|uniref:winged helix-turn-helix domain-containing protein n=1 Tax=Clavibacter michiganensis TaxID=28447 RepID=UPI00292D93F7
ILDHVWEYDFNGDAGIVESYISYLRRKLDQHSSCRWSASSRAAGSSRQPSADPPTSATCGGAASAPSCPPCS